jgi:hypothetical protein
MAQDLVALMKQTKTRFNKGYRVNLFDNHKIHRKRYYSIPKAQEEKIEVNNILDLAYLQLKRENKILGIKSELELQAKVSIMAIKILRYIDKCHLKLENWGVKFGN